LCILNINLLLRPILTAYRSKFEATHKRAP
jgi:hypothetical protein